MMVLNSLTYTLRKVEGGVSETSAAIVYGRGVGETFLQEESPKIPTHTARHSIILSTYLILEIT